MAEIQVRFGDIERVYTARTSYRVTEALIILLHAELKPERIQKTLIYHDQTACQRNLYIIAYIIIIQ